MEAAAGSATASTGAAGPAPSPAAPLADAALELFPALNDTALAHEIAADLGLVGNLTTAPQTPSRGGTPGTLERCPCPTAPSSEQFRSAWCVRCAGWTTGLLAALISVAVLISMITGAHLPGPVRCPPVTTAPLTCGTAPCMPQAAAAACFPATSLSEAAATRALPPPPAVFVLLHRNLRRQRREVMASFLSFQEAEAAAVEVRCQHTSLSPAGHGHHAAQRNVHCNRTELLWLDCQRPLCPSGLLPYLLPPALPIRLAALPHRLPAGGQHSPAALPAGPSQPRCSPHPPPATGAACSGGAARLISQPVHQREPQRSIQWWLRRARAVSCTGQRQQRQC